MGWQFEHIFVARHLHFYRTVYLPKRHASLKFAWEKLCIFMKQLALTNCEVVLIKLRPNRARNMERIQDYSVQIDLKII